MNFELLFPSKYLRAADLQGKDWTLTIQTVKLEKLEGQGGAKKAKGIITFDETDKGLVLNRTCGEAIKLCFGAETADWIGKRLTIYPQMIKDPFADGDIQAIRVRGSPDITRAMQANIQRGQKTIRVSVVPTGAKPKTAKPAPAAPAPAAAAPVQTEAPPPKNGKSKFAPIDVPEGMSEEEALRQDAAALEQQMVAEGLGS